MRNTYLKNIKTCPHLNSLHDKRPLDPFPAGDEIALHGVPAGDGRALGPVLLEMTEL